ncbi:F-type H+-transporting ATPase subunit b [Aurantimicrobium minutum]|uniref:F0F1 ATP synthase subunit B n=1 Tax=Aurantimicrobium minutum TaxID=708131 RepID=UPI002406235E|nr:F0F1 ATP synthase subunit B [Aurantimicrobium minutum]MDF9809083.1 F-type H+-transporting ATPase subunit b [Aurantimicrobium minutum]
MLQALIVASTEGTPNPLLPAPYDIVWSAVVFAIILIFFWKKVLPNVSAMLEARGAAIEGNIEKADAAQREAEEALAKYTAQLADARAEAGKIRDAARADGAKIVTEAKENASTEAARITATAKAQIEAERQSALVSLKSEVGSLAIDLASGVIGEALTDDKKSKALVDRFLADLAASEKAAK